MHDRQDTLGVIMSTGAVFLKYIVTLTLAGCLLILGGATSEAGAQPTVSFTTTQYAAIERYTPQVPIEVVVSEPVVDLTTVYVEVSGGTATPEVDFFSGTVSANIMPGMSDTTIVWVRMMQDTEPEGPETILLTITDVSYPYEIGSPSEATLTIIDDDSDTPAAHFEISEEIPLDPYGRIVLVAEPGSVVEVDLVVDDLPPGGTVIHYTSTADDQIHSLTFTDNPRQTLNVPTADIPPGEVHAANELQILNPVSKRITNSDRCSLYAFQFSPYMPDDAEQCVTCLVNYVWFVLPRYACEGWQTRCGFDCPRDKTLEPQSFRPQPDKAIDPVADYETLQRYRDEVLLGSPGGGYYIQLYRDYSLDIANAILRRPTLIYRVEIVWDLWLPAVAAQVDGQGASFTITGEMQAALLGVMAELEELGNPELANLIAEFRIALDLENITGISAADLQDRVDNNSMEAEPASWGKVKSMYR